MPLSSFIRSPSSCSFLLLLLSIFYHIPLPHRCLHYFRLINFELHPYRRRSETKRDQNQNRPRSRYEFLTRALAPLLLPLLVLLSGFPFWPNRFLIAYFGPKRCGQRPQRTYQLCNLVCARVNFEGALIVGQAFRPLKMPSFWPYFKTGRG